MYITYHYISYLTLNIRHFEHQQLLGKVNVDAFTELPTRWSAMYYSHIDCKNQMFRANEIVAPFIDGTMYSGLR